MRGTPQPPKDWKKSHCKALKKAGFDPEPEQPITMGEEGVDFWEEGFQRRIKLIDKLTLENFAYCLALKEHDEKALILLNGNRLKKSRDRSWQGRLSCQPVRSSARRSGSQDWRTRRIQKRALRAR